MAKLWRLISPKQRKARQEMRLLAAINGEKEAYCRRLEQIELQSAAMLAHLNRMERADESFRVRLTALESHRAT